MILCAIPAFYALYLRFNLPDSHSHQDYNAQKEPIIKITIATIEVIFSSDDNVMDYLVLCGVFILWHVLMVTKRDDA